MKHIWLRLKALACYANNNIWKVHKVQLRCVGPEIKKAESLLAENKKSQQSEDSVMTKLSRDQLIEAISSMSVIELSELVKVLEEKFGVSATTPAAAAVCAAPAAATTLAEEKTEFSVILGSVGVSKINVIKIVREITGLGLKEAKDLVDGAPKIVKENVTKAEAEEIKKKFTEAGATIELK
jgi:large subunit ribosomal protein L7/L12